VNIMQVHHIRLELPYLLPYFSGSANIPYGAQELQRTFKPAFIFKEEGLNIVLLLQQSSFLQHDSVFPALMPVFRME
jgi:hypothetical protein